MIGASDEGRTARLFEAAGPVRLLGFLVVASIVLPVLLFAGFSYLSYRAHYTTAETRLAQTLDVVHEHMRKVLEAHELAALHIVDLLDDRSDADIRSNEKHFHQRLAALKRAMPQVRDLRVLDASARPLVSASIMPFTSTGYLSEQDFFRVHRDKGPRIYVSDVMQSRQRSGMFFLETRRWEDDQGNFRGVVAISVEPQYYHAFFAGFPRGNVFGLVRDDGAVLARYPDPGDAPPRLQPGRGLLAEMEKSPEQGVYRAASAIDGVERIASYRRLPNSPLYVTANFGLPDVVRAWRKDMLSHVMLAGPATFGLFLITLLAYGQARRERLALEHLRQEIDLRQRTEEQLIQAQKMEAVGRLTGGIAHDFNNLLTVVLGNLETLARHLPKTNQRLHRAVANAQMGAERAAALTHRLLAFSRRQPLEVKAVDLNALVAGMADLMRRTIGEAITIESRLGAGLWMTEADPNQTENALLNLVINARDAMPDGGRLTIETANVDISADDSAAKKQGVVPGQYAVLSVSDSGTGIPQDVLDMVFEPFFTTKPAGQGTGLGLSMVYGFMKQSGGHARIDSEIGHGTSVKLYFPRTEVRSEKPANRLAEIPIEPTGNGETILVCEDDDGVRQFSAQTLRDFGYRVVEARDMTDALIKLDDNPGVAALFTDVVLPGEGNGRMLADEARRRRPDLRVLFTTGYTRDAIVRDGRLEEGVELLSKPFSSADLGRRIHALFAASPHQG